MSKEFTKLFGHATRRDVMRGLGATGLTLAVPGLAFGQGGQLVVSNWGGDWNDRTVRFVEEPLVASQGIRIIHDHGMEPERKAKILAERRLPRGTVDVLHLNQGDVYELNGFDILADLDKSRIPNFADVPESLQTMPYFVPWLYSGVVIAYNTETVKEPPQSYAELWDEKWAGRLGLTNQLYFNYVMMAGLINGGNMNNAEAGQEELLRLKELTQPKIYATHQHMQAALVTGEIDVAVNYKARFLQWINDGATLDTQFPSEGAIAVMFGACLPQKAPNPDAAYVYFNAMLDRGAMAQLAEASFYAPANAASDLSDELRAKIDFSPEQQAALNFPDYAYVAENTASWLEWWNKSIAI